MKFPDQYEVTLSRTGEDPVTIWLPEPPPVGKPYRYQGRLWLVISFAFYYTQAA